MSAQPQPLLALDTGSPVVSLALGVPGGPLLTRTLELRQSSEHLLSRINDLLREAGHHISDLGGLVALSGPGSFTGLRVGLATALGLHQALGLPARALPTLPILARAARPTHRDGDQIVAIVDALRGEWMSQTFSLEGGEPQPLEAACLRDADALASSARPLFGFSLEALREKVPSERLFEAPPLAPLALDHALQGKWDPSGLVEPIYFRPPATTPSRVTPSLPSAPA